MARFGKKKKEQFNNRKKKDEQHVSGVRQDYDLAKKENDAFVAYYKAQNILPTDEEFDIFLQKLKDPLPTSFRFTGSRLNTAELRDNMIKSYFPDLQNLTIEVEGVPTQIPLPEPIPWYPNRAGWQWQTSKRELKKNSALTRFHQFLHAETEMGNISRQEAVSMIPCLFLDVEPHHAVLDMCAAPGSKTAQLIEAVQNDEHVIPSGFVIANDSDYSRAQMLVKQTKRLQSPCIVVTNHEAQSFPNIYMNPRSHPERCALQFDRILCDVPCSGDGTFRKNKGIWKTWHHNHANALHKLQVMIIMRAAELLKVGGRLVYSTCSFNPVENEAVVAEAMRQSGGALRIFDVSDRLPELQRREGLVNWKVHSKSKVLYDRWEDVIESDAVGEKKIRESMFIKDGEGEAFGLRRCMRVYPHLQDTGGFFVTVIEKVQEYGPIDAFIAGKQDGDAEEEEMEEVEEANAEEGAPAAEEAEEISAELAERKRKSKESLNDESKRSKVEDASDAVEDKSESEEAKPTDEEVASEIPEESTQTTPPTKEQKNKNLKMAWKGREKPFFFVENDDEIKQFSAMYGLSETFPRDQFVVRSDALKHQTVYFVSSGVKSVLLANNSYRLTVVNTGVKIFSRHDNHTKECPFRLNTEGLSTIGPFLSEVRVLQVPMSDLLVILRMNNPLFSSLSEATEKWLINLGAPGSCMFKYVPTEEDKEKELIQTALLPIWRAGVSASLLLNKVSRQGWLQRILGVEYNAEAEEKLLQDSMVNVGKKDVEEV